MNPEPQAVVRARVRMAFWLLLFYLITLVEGYLSRPFIGHNSSAQNVLYGIAVGAPFWITIIVFLVANRRGLDPGREKSGSGRRALKVDSSEREGDQGNGNV